VVWSQNNWDSLLVVWSQNYWDGFSQFGLKTGDDDFSRFDLKTGGDDFSRSGLKTGGHRFSALGLKTGSFGLVIWASKSPRRFLNLSLKTKRATVCRLCHKSNGGWRRCGHASRSNSLLHVEVGWARVSQFGLKTDGDVTAGGARAAITEVVWGSNWRQMGRFDRLRRTFLPQLYSFLCIMP
jgi:hypothetical protein